MLYPVSKTVRLKVAALGAAFYLALIPAGLQAQVAFELVAKADVTEGKIPLTVKFSTAGTTGTGLRYEWYFKGPTNGILSTEANPTFTYTEAGTYTAQLRAYNSAEDRLVSNFKIVAGNSKPIVTIVEPPDGGFFHWADKVKFSYQVNDAEDGSTVSGTIACKDTKGQTALFHTDHVHGIEQFSVCTGEFQIGAEKTNQEADAGQNMGWIFNAGYSDKAIGLAEGLDASASAFLHPVRKQADFYTGNKGVRIDSTAGDAVAVGNPIAIAVTDIDDGDYISFKPMNFRNITGVSYHASVVGAGGKIEIHVDAPTGPLISTANITATGGAKAFKNFPASSFVDPLGTHEMFFVFIGATPAAKNLFVLDFMDFAGEGVAGPLGLPVRYSLHPQPNAKSGLQIKLTPGNRVFQLGSTVRKINGQSIILDKPH